MLPEKNQTAPANQCKFLDYRFFQGVSNGYPVLSYITNNDGNRPLSPHKLASVPLERTYIIFYSFHLLLVGSQKSSMAEYPVPIALSIISIPIDDNLPINTTHHRGYFFGRNIIPSVRTVIYGMQQQSFVGYLNRQKSF